VEVCNLFLFFFLNIEFIANWFLLFLLLCIGHINHSLFWTNLAPVSSGGGQLASGPLESALGRDFGSFDEFKKIFNTTTAAIQGSGWGWLVGFFLFSYEKSEKFIYVCVNFG
jgi:superoxide dismutase